MNQLGEILRRIRINRAGHSTTLADFGRSVGASGQFIGLVERGRKRISEDLARRIAERYGKSEEDRRSLLRELLDANAAYGAPEAFALTPGERALVPEAPLAAIVALMGEDMASAGLNPAALGDALGVPPNAVERFLSGRVSLSREAIRKLADVLGADPDEYAVAAGYLPDFLRTTLQDDVAVNEHRTVSRRAAAALDESLSAEAALPGPAIGDFPRKVQEDMAAAGLSEAEAAIRTGISLRRLPMLLAGDVPMTRDEARGLADAVGSDPDLYLTAGGFLSAELANALVSAPDLFDLLRRLTHCSPEARSLAVATLKTLIEQFERPR